MVKELNDKQKAFAKEYVVNLNGADAARKAGYSVKTANVRAVQLLTTPNVQEYVQKLMTKRSDKLEITADFVLKNIVEAMECAKSEQNFNAWLKATELLGKHLKLFTDVSETNMNFTNMGRVMLVDPKTGDKKALSFNVGEDPNKL